MNANHARPLVAFWLLALVAAVVTSVGLRAGSTPVDVRAGSPSPVGGTEADVVLGGVLSAQHVPANPSVPAFLGSAAAAEHALTVADSPSTRRHRKQGLNSGSGQLATAPANGTGTTQGETGTATGTTRHQRDPTKTTATSTSTTDPTHGKGHAPTDPGNGKGKGR